MTSILKPCCLCYCRKSAFTMRVKVGKILYVEGSYYFTSTNGHVLLRAACREPFAEMNSRPACERRLWKCSFYITPLLLWIHMKTAECRYDVNLPSWCFTKSHLAVCFIHSNKWNCLVLVFFFKYIFLL